MRTCSTGNATAHGTLAALATTALLLCVPSPGEAEDLFLIQEVPDPTALGDLMYPDADTSTQRELRVRAIRFTDTEPENPASAAQPEAETAPAASTGAAVGFNIQFALNSPQLLPEALPYLDAVGAMLIQERTADTRLMIAGHADALGDAVYNQQLSEARAISVSSYLMQNYGIGADRLLTRGFGEEKPLPDTDPNDGLNRRVEFHPLP